MDEAERQAIFACQQGDLTQFTFLYEQHVARVYRFVYFKTWHRETAEDLTSVTFMKALEKIGSYAADKGNFSSWLYRIAQNTVIDHYRATKPTVDLDQVFNLASRQNVGEEVQHQLTLEQVKVYFTSLPPEVQELLIMRLWQDMTYQEIAEVTGKSEGALKMATSRALRNLRAAVPHIVLLFMNYR
ncbi:MAG: sigma-70 family RNA polymerase sigma factor [Candidatus Veblenbacteria bacterium]|nr:sigma-70 family RNA polymerase sigma factor [Candidatus Veblenbacteria bacterium]